MFTSPDEHSCGEHWPPNSTEYSLEARWGIETPVPVGHCAVTVPLNRASFTLHLYWARDRDAIDTVSTLAPPLAVSTRSPTCTEDGSTGTWNVT